MVNVFVPTLDVGARIGKLTSENEIRDLCKVRNTADTEARWGSGRTIMVS